MNAHATTADAPARDCDLLTLSAGAIEGGVEQIIASVIPAAVNRPGVVAWSFERTLAPATAVQLIVDVEPSALDDVIETCEDMISSSLEDNLGLVMRPLVEVPFRPEPNQDFAWGVHHRTFMLPGTGEDQGRFWALEQSSSVLAQAIVAGAAVKGWDRKAIGPALLDRLTAAAAGRDGASARSYAIMQALLAGHSSVEVLTRQFRANAHRLGASGQIPLTGEADAPLAAVDGELAALAAAARHHVDVAQPAMLAEIWRRLCGRIGFSAIEAAYLACLASTAQAQA